MNTQGALHALSSGKGDGTTTRDVLHLIDGEWRGAPAAERRNPADHAQVVVRAPVGSARDATDAVAAASAAFPSWSAVPPPKRGAILLEAASLLAQRFEEIARDLTAEEGKTLAESRLEVQRAVDIFRYYGGEGWRLGGETIPSANSDTFLYTKRESLGPVAVITPWNFPIAIPSWKIAPALVSGDTVVFKPASLTPLTAYNLVKALVDAGIPKGVVNLVYGSGADVGEAMASDSAVRAITFTGSTSVGRRLHAVASPHMPRVQLEMGGKNALVVTESASPERAAAVAAAGGFGLTGQACSATSRLVAVGSIYEPLVEALAKEIASRQPGNGLDSNVRLGPVVSESQLATDLSYIELGRSQGANLVAGGRHHGGNFLEASLFVDVDPHHRIWREEVFGPLIAITRASDLDEAIDIVNDSEYGLIAGICSNELNSVHQFVDRAQAGVIKVNQPTTGLELQMPFGGVKASSTATYREQGQAAIEFFTQTKSIYMNYGSGS